VKARHITSATVAALLVAMALPGTAGAADMNVDAGDFFYRPYRVEVNPGDTVTWRILPGSRHTVTTRKSAPVQFDSGLKEPGQSFAYTFAAPGRYSLYCVIHPGQDGVVQVGRDTVDPRLSRVRLRRGERSVRVRFRLSEDARVKAVVYRNGKRVKTIRTRALREGAHSVLYRPSTLGPGRYRVKLSATDVEGNAGAAVSKRFRVP
jgi:plastocyanin